LPCSSRTIELWSLAATWTTLALLASSMC